MYLEQLRVAVRTQLDIDETELPNVLLDLYIQDGYDHVIGLERRWPFFETLWHPVVISAGRGPIPVDAREIETVMANGQMLTRIDPRHAQMWFPLGPSTTTAAYSNYWSQFGTELFLYPPTSGDVALTLRGYRQPTDWINGGASAEVDADPRLHLPIIWFACALGYAQQEDEVLEATYMTRFREAASLAHDDVMRAWSGSPKILNGYHALGGLARQPQLIINTAPTVEFDGSIIGGTP